MPSPSQRGSAEPEDVITPDAGLPPIDSDPNGKKVHRGDPSLGSVHGSVVEHELSGMSLEDSIISQSSLSGSFVQITADDGDDPSAAPHSLDNDSELDVIMQSDIRDTADPENGGQSDIGSSSHPTASTEDLYNVDFLIDGTPSDGRKTRKVDGELLQLLGNAIEVWKELAKRKNISWDAYVDQANARCVNNRLRKWNFKRAPVHTDPEHRTACIKCTSSGALCVFVPAGCRPVVLPLPASNMLADVAEGSLGWYVNS